MTLDIKFEKNGLKFSFRNPVWDKYAARLYMEYKIIGIKENDRNDGYYSNGQFVPEREAITFDIMEIDGRKVNGVKLPKDILKKVNSTYKQLKEDDMNRKLYGDIRYTLNDTTAYGIYNGISRFDINEIINQLNIDDCFILAEDVADILNKDTELKEIALANYQANPEGNWNDEYRDWFIQARKEKKAPGFGIIPNSIIRNKIAKIIKEKTDIEKKREQEYADKLENLLKTAKETGKKQLIESWIVPCNDPNEECNMDICYRWILPNGEIKETREHTY